MDINGFIPSTLEIVRRNESSNEGAAGTVDATHFENWVETYLLPKLGRYEYNEPRSIVVMDNATTHMGQRVGDLIRSSGAILLYTAPYSPDLNPIELGFSNYKSHLKRNYQLGLVDWYEAHCQAIKSVSRDTCIKSFRHCGVPLSESVLTREEEEQLENKNKLQLLLALVSLM
jgi:transposase